MTVLAHSIMFFLASVLGVLIFWRVRGGKIARLLRTRHAGFWEEHERPFPSLWGSAQSRRFDRFIMQREYLALNDPLLSEKAELLRRFIVIMLIWFIGGLVVLSAVGWIVRYGFPTIG